MAKKIKRQKPGPKPTPTPCEGLRAAIAATETTESNFARSIGIVPSTLSNWIKLGVAPRENLEVACEALGLTLDDVEADPDERPAERRMSKALKSCVAANAALVKAAMKLRARIRVSEADPALEVGFGKALAANAKASADLEVAMGKILASYRADR